MHRFSPLSLVCLVGVLGCNDAARGDDGSRSAGAEDSGRIKDSAKTAAVARTVVGHPAAGPDQETNERPFVPRREPRVSPDLSSGAGTQRSADPERMARTSGILGIMDRFLERVARLIPSAHGAAFAGTGGYGWGLAGFGCCARRVPRVSRGRATVSGNLDKDIIRRTVRGHINEVRFCYRQGLAREPELGGRVLVEFVIGGIGEVTASSVTKTTVGDEDVGTCIAKAAKRWTFPRPSDGTDVTVGYPFSLSPG